MPSVYVNLVTLGILTLIVSILVPRILVEPMLNVISTFKAHKDVDVQVVTLGILTLTVSNLVIPNHVVSTEYIL